MGEDKKYTYFDDTTDVLTPIYVVGALAVVVLLLFVL